MGTMKTVRLVLAVAGILMAGGFAGAQAPDPHGMGPGFGMHRPPMERALGDWGAQGQWWNNPNIAKQLNLTDDQRKAMDEILHEHRLKLIDLRAGLETAEVNMQPLISADTPDRAAIEAQIDKVVQARAALEKANSLFLLDIRMKLTPDQWKQLKTLRQTRMQRKPMRDHGPGAWGQGRPGRQFHRPQTPPPGAAPQGAPAPAPGAQPAGSGEVQ